MATSAAPYGYTLTIWTSGAVATHARGTPTALEALLFLAGAVAGFGLVGAAAHGGPSGILAGADPDRPTVRLWGGFHVPSVGFAIAAATGLTALVHGSLVWPLVGFSITVIYLVVIAGQFTIADSQGRSWRRGRGSGSYE